MKKMLQQVVDFLLKKYEWLLSLLLKIQPVRVNRERYVRRVVERGCKGGDCQEMVDRALATSLLEVVDTRVLKKEYRRVLWRYGILVFVVSYLLTLVPDELCWTILSGAADLIFFQCMLFLAMQKILLLYGTREDMEDDEQKSVEALISIDSSGLMIGKHPVLQKMKSAVGWAGKQVVKKLGPEMVAKASRSVFIVLRRQTVKWLSIVIAREHVDFVFNAMIPLTCALISGLVSVVIFVPMCNKLRKHLVKKNVKGQ